MKSANPVATPVLARNDDDEDGSEATAEEHPTLRRTVGKS